MFKTHKYGTNTLEQLLYIFMNISLLFVINVSKLGRVRSRSICVNTVIPTIPKKHLHASIISRLQFIDDSSFVKLPQCCIIYTQTVGYLNNSLFSYIH